MTTDTAMPTKGSIRYVLYHYIKKFPGKSSKDASDFTGLTPEQTAPALSEMFRAGYLNRQKIPGSHGAYAYFIAERSPAPQPTSTIEECNAYIATLEHRLTVLEAEIRELEAWKAAAITAHPDLVPVDPLLVKAREICAQEALAIGSHEAAEAYRKGAYDNRMMLKIALKSLQEGKELANA